MGVKSYLSVVLIYGFVTISNIECFLMYFLGFSRHS